MQAGVGQGERLISILLKPRASVKFGDYYGPAPRRPTLPRKGGDVFGSPPAA